jgi:uncharacterized membrane protein
VQLSRLLLRWVLPVLAVAVVAHLATVLAVPRVVMMVAMGRVAQAAPGGPLHAPPIDAAARLVPLPSPDLLYSSCVLDVSGGPELVSVTPGAAYLSVAVFDARSDNVFVTDDHDAGGKAIAVLVTGPGDPAVAPAGVAVARLGSARGLVLVRGLAATPAQAAISEQARHTLACRKWRGG